MDFLPQLQRSIRGSAALAEAIERTGAGAAGAVLVSDWPLPAGIWQDQPLSDPGLG